jgi:hypothetical protein
MPMCLLCAGRNNGTRREVRKYREVFGSYMRIKGEDQRMSGKSDLIRVHRAGSSRTCRLPGSTATSRSTCAPSHHHALALLPSSLAHSPAPAISRRVTLAGNLPFLQSIQRPCRCGIISACHGEMVLWSSHLMAVPNSTGDLAELPQ